MIDKIEIKKTDNGQDKFWLKPFFDYQEHILNLWQKMSPAWILPACERYERVSANKLRLDTQKIWAAIYNNNSMFVPWLSGAKTEPYIDIIEEETRFKIIADVPGVNAEGLKIECTDDALTIQGYRIRETPNEKGYIRSECCHGHFSRTIALPADADVDHATAKLDKNVLKIEIPKRSVLLDGLRDLKAKSEIKAVA